MTYQASDDFLSFLENDTMRGRAEYRRALFGMRKMQEAYSHFVPKKLLELLGVEDIGDAAPGNEIELNLAVMFCDIRDFTSLSETMSSRETFSFLNSYLAKIEPAIQRHEGTIDKFIGDGVMALFPKSSDNAIDAAVAMIKALRRYNESRAQDGMAPIEVGIGINSGLTTLGVIGHSERMETTVIGDAVNVASRVEGLTKPYKTSILISEDTLLAISDANRYCIRYVDRVRVKGRVRPISVYEVFDADAPELADAKLAGLEIFEKAVAYYHLREVDKAHRLLKPYADAIPGDVIAHIYLERCCKYLENGVYEGIGELQEQLEWVETFNSGNARIDEEHGTLMVNINKLSAALLANNTKAVSDVLAFLEDYSIAHFSMEEGLMQKHQYPFMAAHLFEHDKFIKRLNNLKEEFESASQDRLYSLFRVNLFLFDWLISHSTRVDKHLAKFVAEKEAA